MRRVLVTGAAGNIGSYFAAHAHQSYALRLMVQRTEEGTPLTPYGEVVTCDLGDLPALTQLCQGVDTVVHLAADPDPAASWMSLLPNNIVGTYHAMIAAKDAGCRRLIYASSIHAVSGYPPDLQVRGDDPVNPEDLYGVSKCFGEALGRYMAEQQHLSVIALRIGGFQPPEAMREERFEPWLHAFISPDDLTHLICRCIEAEHLTFAILHALSANRHTRLDISEARRLVGYSPQDDAFREHDAARGQGLLEHSS